MGKKLFLLIFLVGFWAMDASADRVKAKSCSALMGTSQVESSTIRAETFLLRALEPGAQVGDILRWSEKHIVGFDEATTEEVEDGSVACPLGRVDAEGGKIPVAAVDGEDGQSAGVQPDEFGGLPPS